MEFVIPMRREDLMNSTDSRQYRVEELLTPREITDRWDECQHALEDQGPAFIIEYFDIFYSWFSHSKKMGAGFGQNMFSIMKKALSVLLNDLNLLLDDLETIDDDIKMRTRNTLKMMTYILCQQINEFETVVAQSSMGKGNKKVKSKQVLTSDDGWNWEAEKLHIIELLQQLCLLPIHWLWTPAVIEDDFINLLSNCCYKCLENPTINQAKELKGVIFHLLGNLLKKQNNVTGSSIKIVQLLHLFEHLAVILAQAVIVFVEEYGMKHVVNEVIREIGNTDPEDLSSDGSGTRSVSHFLVEVSQRLPALIISNIGTLVTHLDGDAYSMRICVLGIMGEILQNTLNRQDLEDKSRTLRDQFMDRLEDHIHDVNAFVRSRVMQIWTRLCQAGLIPIVRQARLLEVVVGRVHDKSCLVRKHAIELLTALLQKNPFGAELSLEELKLIHTKEKAKLLTLMTSDNEDKATDYQTPDGQENWSESEDRVNNLSNGGTTNTPPQAEEQVKQKALIRYLEDAIKFAGLINEAFAAVSQLLGSHQNSDVLEAIQFFVTAVEFGVQNARQGFKKMLTLIWSKEALIKAAVVMAYKKIYLNSVTSNDGNRKTSKLVVDNLTTLTRDATLGELASLEELICELVKNEDIGDEIFEVLLQRFVNKKNSYSIADSNAAVVLLGMVGSVNSDIIKNNLHLFATIGLCERAVNDFKFARDVCNAFLKLSGNAKPSSTSKETPFRLPRDHLIFRKMSDLIVKGFENLNDGMWVPMMEVAVDVLYKLSEHPEEICEDIIKGVIRNWCKINEGAADQKCYSLHLVRFLLLCGNVSLCQVSHLDIGILSELKRRHQMTEATTSNKNRRKCRSLHPINTGGESATKEASSSMLEDCELSGAVIDDQDADFINKICEKEIVTGGNNLLAWLVPFVVTIASRPEMYSAPEIQRAASLALSKCMMVSSDFCDAHMQLLITILEKSPDLTVRANIMVALGPLACRFPNIISPWSPHLYARLHDESREVRHNALVILTQLILHDMIKVKGPISDMALCIVDKDERISNLATLFFKKLAEKGNAIYNLLPEIISRLSDAEVGTSEENFQAILKYLLPFVQKDRLIENMVEQLCQRFRCTRLERQWRDLAFCLSRLCTNEKCYRKLLDNLSSYADKLMEPKVYDTFCNMLLMAKKSTKIENKAMIEELDAKLEECYKKTAEEEEVCNKASKVIKDKGCKTDVFTTRATNITRVTRSTSKVTNTSILPNNTTDKTSRRNPGRGVRNIRSKKLPPLTFSLSEDENSS